MDFFDIQALSKLLNCETNSYEQNQPETSRSSYAIPLPKTAGPSDIAPNVAENNPQAATDIGPDGDSNNKSIWKDEIFNEDGDFNASLTTDSRQTPEYTIHYKQSVGAEDVFLQMGNRHPGSASCQNLVIQITLPQEIYENIQINIEKRLLDLRSPKYFLHLPLPDPVNPRGGNAEWDSKTSRLIVTLDLDREFDFLNQ